jgi:hypothetical protein
MLSARVAVAVGVDAGAEGAVVSGGLEDSDEEQAAIASTHATTRNVGIRQVFTASRLPRPAVHPRTPSTEKAQRMSPGR